GADIRRDCLLLFRSVSCPSCLGDDLMSKVASFLDYPVQNPVRTGQDLTESEHLRQVLLQNPTEDSVALAYRTTYKDREVYMHGRGCWLDWTGEYWAEDTCKRHYDRIRNLARAANLKGHAAAAKAS